MRTKTQPVVTSGDHVHAALDASLALGEIGVQVAAFSGDELIVNDWAGTADRRNGRPVDGATLFSLFSVSKAITATAVHIQAERGLIDYAEPISRYWPEFASAGKEKATVEHALTHRLGIPQMPAGVTVEHLADWEWMVAEIAALPALYPPGTRNTYLPMTFGWVLGEIVRRTDPLGRPFGQFVRDELCRPLGIEDLWFGVPRDDGVTGRIAHLESASFVLQQDDGEEPDETRLGERAIPRAVTLSPEIYNLPVTWHSCIPATGALASARGVATVFAMLANGGEFQGIRLLSADRINSFTNLRHGSDEPDMVNGVPMVCGAGGYWVTAGGEAPEMLGSGKRVLFHPGRGGTMAWADTDTGLSAAVCHNRMFTPEEMRNSGDPFGKLGDALRARAAPGVERSGAC